MGYIFVLFALNYHCSDKGPQSLDLFPVIQGDSEHTLGFASLVLTSTLTY